MRLTTTPTQRRDPVLASAPPIVVGVDTHQLTHTAALIDIHYLRLGHREFPATDAGHRELLAWACSHGPIAKIGVESTGSYGAGLTRHLVAAEHDVFEVNRPEKATRVKHGKSDPVDAYSAAEQVLAGRVTARAKLTTGVVEAIRAVKVARDGAVKNRTAAFSQLRDLITAAPAGVHDELIGLTARGRVTRSLAMRPDIARIHEPLHATRYALRALARRIKDLDTEIDAADKILTKLTRQAAPSRCAIHRPGRRTDSGRDPPAASAGDSRVDASEGAATAMRSCWADETRTWTTKFHRPTAGFTGRPVNPAAAPGRGPAYVRA